MVFLVLLILAWLMEFALVKPLLASAMMDSLAPANNALLEPLERTAVDVSFKLETTNVMMDSAALVMCVTLLILAEMSTDVCSPLKTANVMISSPAPAMRATLGIPTRMLPADVFSLLKCQCVVMRMIVLRIPVTLLSLLIPLDV